MTPFSLSFDEALDRCPTETDRVRPIVEVLTCLLSRYQITIEPAVTVRSWANVDLSGDLASQDLAVFAD